MSTFTIPNSQGQIRQSNDGEIFGEIIESFNLDLSSSKGKIKVSNKLVPVLTEGVELDASPFGGFVDMVIWDNNYYIFTDNESYQCLLIKDPTDPANWSETTGIADLNFGSTVIPFDGSLATSLDDDIALFDGAASDNDWWTNVEGGAALDEDFPHVLEVVQSGKETLYVTDKNFVRYLEKGGTTKNVELDSNVVAICLAPALSGSMWVGTYSTTSTNAYVYEIFTGEVVGSTSVYNQAYKINAPAVLAIWTYNNTPYIVTSRGDIQVFNGAGFVKVAEFPFKFSARTLDGVEPGFIEPRNWNRPIHPRGVKVHNNSAFIQLNSNSEEDVYAVNTRTHSGVWEFDHTTSQLIHRFSPSDTLNQYGISSYQNQTYPILIVDNSFTFMIVGAYNKDTEENVIYMTDRDAVNQGYFVTPEITSQSVTDAYEAVYHKAKTLASGEEIVMQYRTSKRDTVYGTANWTSTTTFTSLSDLSEIAVGDLIRVSHGYAAGDYCNVVSIEKAALTYTVTVDREIGAVGEISYVYSDNFKKEPTTYTSADGEYKKMGGYGTNPWIQFMVILKGDIEYRQFISHSNAKNQM